MPLRLTLSDQLLVERFDTDYGTLTYEDIDYLRRKDLVVCQAIGALHYRWELTELGQRALWLIQQRGWLSLSDEHKESRA